MAAQPSLYWYDLETSGINPKYHRIVQFAGVRTDLNLNIIGDPLVQYCKLPNDVLPDLDACMVTGITPQQTLQKGLSEADLIKLIHNEFSKANTCVLGYNNIRFDDEFIRYSLYRNFYDAYEREWKNGNSRWDLIDVVRLTRALRPQGIEWPIREDGNTSYRLEELTKANNIQHESAHDALSDVLATIEMAKLIKQKQTKLFDYVYQNKNKHAINQQFDLVNKKPLIHISGMYTGERYCSAMIAPLAEHPINKNGMIVYDLSVDPEPLINLPVSQIKDLIYTKTADLPEGVQRIAIKTIHVNKCPIIVPVSTLDEKSIERIGLDIETCKRNLETLKAISQLSKKVQSIFKDEKFEGTSDADYDLYSGFFGNRDKQMFSEIRDLSPQQLGASKITFDDNRAPDLLFRYRARNYPETLNETEREHWEEFRQQRFLDPGIDSIKNWQQYNEDLDARLQDQSLTSQQHQILRDIKQYIDEINPF